MPDLENQIEEYLLARRDWVPAAEIAARFSVRARALRKLGGRPGLCSKFAISSTKKGLKHVDIASTAEWIEFKHSLRKHGISELIHVRDLDRRRARVTRAIQRPPIRFEKDSKQLVLI